MVWGQGNPSDNTDDSGHMLSLYPEDTQLPKGLGSKGAPVSVPCHIPRRARLLGSSREARQGPLAAAMAWSHYP